MPLDPFFRERLRTHRRYLAKKAWTDLTVRFRPAPPAATASASAKKTTPLTPRERHRRAALNWEDRKSVV